MLAVTSIISAFIALLATVSAVTIHPTSGRYAIDSSVHVLVDHSREDPFAAADGRTKARRVLISSFVPVGRFEECDPYTVPYMPPATAAAYDAVYSSYGLPNETFTSLKLSLCRTPRRFRASGRFPVVLFSPGLGNSRLIYSSMAQSLASQGYVVITMDHPYDANIVEFPDGSVILAANISTDMQIEYDLNIRQQDSSFLMDRLQYPSARRHVFGHFADRVDIRTDSFQMFGHSLGGATAVLTQYLDPRVTSAVNLDGSLFGPVVEQGVRCPVLFFGHQGKNASTDESWSRFWRHTKSTTRVELEVLGATHASFTDFPKLVETLPLPAKLKSALAPLLGTVPGSDMEKIMDTYLPSFFKFSTGKRFSPMPQNDGDQSMVNVVFTVKDGHCKAPGCL